MNLQPVDGGVVAERLGIRIAQMTIDYQVLLIQCETISAENDALRLEVEQLRPHTEWDQATVSEPIG